jgi:site-specific DNA recombinase
MPNAVVYTRVSSDRQLDGMSLGEQQRLCKEYCKRQGFKIAHAFVEEGESAKNADRTKLQELLVYCRNNKDNIDYLVVHKLDRFARSMSDHMALRALLNKLEIKLQSASEPISESTTGVLMENVLASFAQFDNDMRAERCRGGMAARAKEGAWISHAPVGYVNMKDIQKRPTLALADKSEVKNVKSFFDKFSTGKYRQSDAVALAERCGIRTYKGNVMSKTGVIGMLSNVVYAGYVQNKLTDGMRVPGLHIKDAIISLDQFNLIQDILAGRKRKHAPPSRFKAIWPLRRFLLCGNCGHKLTGSSPRGRTGVYAQYHCTKCTIKKCGVRVSIPKDQAHDDFARLLEQIVPSDWALKVFKTVVLRRWNLDFRDVQDERREIDSALKKLEDRKNKLVEFLLDSNIKQDDYNEQHARIAAQRDELTMKRAELQDVELNKEEIVDRAIEFISNARSIWEAAAAEDKARFQKVVTETGIPVNPDQTFGTTHLSPIYEELTLIESSVTNKRAELPTENSALVYPTGFEPTTFGSASRRSIQLSYGYTLS